MKENRRPLVILTGPTAVGKTDLSIDLAKKIHGEIISADSIQVYKKMDIGSAKIRTEEMQGVVHHLIDVLDPKEAFNIVRFKEMALAAMEGIYERGHIPIITGGTGFYIQGLLYDIQFEETNSDDGYRKELEQYAAIHGAKALHDRLCEVDPASAKAIHFNNQKRVIRALEFYHQTKTPISEHNEEERMRTSPYSFVYFVLNRPRHELYERINQRVDLMMEQGLLDEIISLKEQGYDRSLVSMQGLGYKELFAYLDGEVSLEGAVDTIKQETRHFAKRQLTWFRREKEVTWVNMDEFHYSKTDILDYMISLLTQKGIMPVFVDEI